jgi:hypothetical protein
MINILKSLYYKIKFIINDKKINNEINYKYDKKLNNSFKYNHNHNNFRNFATPCNFNHEYWS